jgi:hypothetical protein
MVMGKGRAASWLKGQQEKDVQQLFEHYEIEDKIHQLRAAGALKSGRQGVESNGGYAQYQQNMVRNMTAKRKPVETTGYVFQERTTGAVFQARVWKKIYCVLKENELILYKTAVKARKLKRVDLMLVTKCKLERWSHPQTGSERGGIFITIHDPGKGKTVMEFVELQTQTVDAAAAWVSAIQHNISMLPKRVQRPKMGGAKSKARTSGR